MNPARDVIGMTDGNLMEKRRHRAMRSEEEIRAILDKVKSCPFRCGYNSPYICLNCQDEKLCKGEDFGEWVLNDKGEK